MCLLTRNVVMECVRGGEGRKERQGIRMRCEEKKRKERNRWRVMNE